MDLFHNDVTVSNNLLQLAKETALSRLRYRLRRVSTMLVSCYAVGCANRFSKESDITFCRFPEEQGGRRIWIRAISCVKWELKDHRRLDGEHFVSQRSSKDPEDIDYVPTVFKNSKRRHVTTKTPGREKEQ